MFDDNKDAMDWTLAIDRQRDALVRMVAALVVMAGGTGVLVLPRFLRAEIWRVLRPAEAAFRRLLVVVKHVYKIEARVAAPHAGGAFPVVIPRGTGGRLPVFALFDPRKHFDFKGRVPATRGNPNIRFFDGYDEAIPPKPLILPDDPVSAQRLSRRLQALQRALDNLPKQARRLARWQMKRADAGGITRPLRPGRPPGHRARGRDPVDEALRDCHALALYVLHPPDT